jgi:tRNA-dihydrouridine synthase A
MGINTIKNRNIPPLNYEVVDKLKDKFNKLNFVVNGGIKNLNEVKTFNNKGFGCMIGRAAYDNPYLFKNADSEIFNKKNIGLNRKEIIYKYSDYCNQFLNEFEGKFGKGIINDIIKPLTNLFFGEKNNSEYRNLLYSINKVNNLENKNFDIVCDHLYNVVEKYEKINSDAINIF